MKIRQLALALAAVVAMPLAQAAAQGIGTTYCTSTVNSTGQAGVLEGFGVALPSGSNLALVASNCPAGSVGIFFLGQDQASIPFMDGTLCINPGSGGFKRIQPPKVIDNNGFAVHSLGLADLTPGPGGDPFQLALNYQFWFRDVAAGNTGSNTTSAVEITFPPCLNCK